MSLNSCIKNPEKHNIKKNYQSLFIFLICFTCFVHLTTVSFFVFNEENRVLDPNTSDLSYGTIIPENGFIESKNGEEERKNIKYNTLHCESVNNEIKYYIPNIITIPYRNNMLLNSNILKTSFESNQENIEILLKNVSVSALLLFLKLLDNPDIIVIQIKIQDFLDILMIVSRLNIKKSKERNHFLKELLKNFMFAMQNENQDFDFDSFYEGYNQREIERSILMDLLIYCFDYITFNDKSAQRSNFLTGNKYIRFNSLDILFNTFNVDEKDENIIFLRFDDQSIKKLYKMLNVKYLLDTCRFLLNITNLDLLDLIFSDLKTDENAMNIFSNIILHTKKLYIHYAGNPKRLFSKKQINVFSKNLKVLKFEFDYTADELKDILESFNCFQKLIINTRKCSFDQLRTVINFSLKNKSIICKLFPFNFELLNIDFDFLKLIPNNCTFYARNFKKESENTEVPIQYLPYLNKYLYSNKKDSKFLLDFVRFECSRYKCMYLNFENNSSPFELDNTALILLSCLDSIKTFSLKNIVITDELLLFILNSNTFKTFGAEKFVFKANFNFLSNNNAINQNLISFNLIDSFSDMDSRFLIFLERFRRVELFKLIWIDIKYSASYFKKIRKYIFGSITKRKKISLKCLKIITALDDDKTTNYLDFISNTYDFSGILSIYYHVYSITNIEYSFLSKMTSLELISIGIYNSSNYIDFEKIFTDSNIFGKIESLAILSNMIRREDIDFFKKFKCLKILYLSCEILEYATISYLKKNNLRNVNFQI
ncbi:hypothetical protein CWI38_0045p0030 [Hamiltosporidium tvaerminnensis]|uniref:Uncharacterized protein n=1 Tax=Hamiltosporidium tvaerminnensis TaxID=1176355 RepID=A0A4V2JVS5_9MICR|nr:hypothetical protein CWI37_0033p0010 [Hamiltosporidium tvaerminnensis]TBU20609.1 hypothetical protein CWI38_0045p0030 [Hamiltosporidium tvaerminnensis]